MKYLCFEGNQYHQWSSRNYFHSYLKLHEFNPNSASIMYHAVLITILNCTMCILYFTVVSGSGCISCPCNLLHHILAHVFQYYIRHELIQLILNMMKHACCMSGLENSNLH